MVVWLSLCRYCHSREYMGRSIAAKVIHIDIFWYALLVLHSLGDILVDVDLVKDACLVMGQLPHWKLILFISSPARLVPSHPGFHAHP